MKKIKFLKFIYFFFELINLFLLNFFFLNFEFILNFQI